MADAVTSQILENGSRRLVMAFTNVSDGTGEAGVVKVDATSATFGVTIAGRVYLPGTHLKVVGIYYDIAAMKLRMLWDADTDVNFLVLGGFGHWQMLDRRGGFQGIINPKTVGATGSILFTTVGAAANSTYSVILEMVKGVPQS